MNKNKKLLRIYAEWKEYSGQAPVWIKTVKCTPYTIIFNKPSETHDDEYDIIDKNGKHVGILRNSQGLFLFFIIYYANMQFVFISISEYLKPLPFSIYLYQFCLVYY